MDVWNPNLIELNLLDGTAVDLCEDPSDCGAPVDEIDLNDFSIAMSDTTSQSQNLLFSIADATTNSVYKTLCDAAALDGETEIELYLTLTVEIGDPNWYTWEGQVPGEFPLPLPCLVQGVYAEIDENETQTFDYPTGCTIE